ncbi:hypothetical protein DSO57_1025681 [Entomophthora muscae]|uniref:Uncharacterized protein n=1 Tax=Entomophthora muscae TaxID=34485 RepID=A0ACC2U107_9FUNG|nr:hypothetical protein DSO57_1025681 [Entomophthora muscae]
MTLPRAAPALLQLWTTTGKALFLLMAIPHCYYFGTVSHLQQFFKLAWRNTVGIKEFDPQLINEAVFNEDHEEMVIVKNIDVFSLCDHYLVPFTGKISIGYIPDGRVLGLSKLARLAEMFARRLQVQERLTRQITEALEDVLKPQGVAVVMESSHLCMVMRGVENPGSIAVTSCMLGMFRKDPKTCEEFYL